MTGYRADLPQLKPGLFVSDGGMETTLIFHEGVELPHFASFVLLDSEEGRARLRAYYERYLAIARRHGRGLMLDSPTWRANPDWGAKLGYDAAGLKRINEASIALLDELRQAWETAQTPIVVAGVIGPRGDGYAEGRMSATEAEDYHAPQIASFAQTAADMVAAYTLNYVEEAIGIARAARALAMPCSISFTVETDGKLIGGRSLRDAVETVDRETDAAPAYYMINCAHPTHFEQALSADAPWMKSAARRQGQRFDEKPRRAGRIGDARLRRSHRSRPQISEIARDISRLAHPGRMLRDGRSPCRRDLRSLRLERAA